MPANKIPGGQNVLLDEQPGAIIKRNGTTLLSTLPSGLPPRDGYVFVRADGTVYLIASDGVSVYQTVDPTVQGAWVLIVTGLNPLAFLEFEVAEDKLWMSNGIDPVMSWDGVILSKFDREFTVTINNSGITISTVSNTQLTQANGFWTGQKLTFTTGANQGVTVTVTNFVNATNTITFSPSVGVVAVTDRFKVGLIIPAGRLLRFWDGHLFVGSTITNPSEIRFHALTDPNTGNAIRIDSPLAWPAQNQVNIYTNDGDRLWGISPVLRDRFLLHKSSGIFRLERDPLTVYRPELVTREIGSRFPKSWSEKSELLYFLGQDKDGIPNVFKTDMVTVAQVDPTGGIEPTLRLLKQPNSVQRSVLIGSPEIFNQGVLSTLTRVDESVLEVGSYPTQPVGNQWAADILSASNVDIESNPGIVSVLGSPVWGGRYEGFVLPESDGWIQGFPRNFIFGSPQQAFSNKSVSLGNLNLGTNVNFSAFPASGILYTRSNILSSGQDSLMSIRSNGAPTYFGLANGQTKAWFSSSRYRNAQLQLNTGGLFSQNSGAVLAVPAGFHTFTLLLKSNGTYKIWMDGNLLESGTSAVTTFNKVEFGQAALAFLTDPPQFANEPQFLWSQFPLFATYDFIYYHTNFKGDQLSSQGGKLSPAVMPNTLAAFGEIVLLNDLQRTPDALARLVQTMNQGLTALGNCGVTAASLIVVLDPATTMSKFFVGEVVDIRTLSDTQLIANGSQRTITAVNVGGKTITLDAPGGVVTTSGNQSVYQYFGTIGMESWTSDTVDFSAGNDPANYLAVANGVVPTSQVKRAQRIRVTLTNAGQSLSPDLDTLRSGILWTSAPIFIGQNINSWRTFLDTLVTPAGSYQTIKIRRTAVLSIPIESDWGPWIAIASGNNIGTILADGMPPTSRWVQAKVEEGVTSVGVTPTVDSLQYFWDEGIAANLPVFGTTHKKRYLFTGAERSTLQNDTVIVSDRNEAWMLWIGLTLNAMLHFKSLFVGFSGIDSKVLQLDATNIFDDLGEPIDAYIDTREELLGDEEITKWLTYSYLHLGPTAGNLIVYTKNQGDTDFGSPKTITLDGSSKDVRQQFPFGSKTVRFQRRYRNNFIGQNMNLRGETVYFNVATPQST